jgi:hypothetical protein
MGLESARLRRFVRHAVVAATDDAAPDAAQLRAAFELLCQRLWLRLRPMFGELALRALLARSLHVAQTEHPWLQGVTLDGSGCSFNGIDTVSRDLPPHILADGLSAILTQKIALLSAFIGDDVVLPLVEQSWGAASLTDRPASTEGES